MTPLIALLALLLDLGVLFAVIGSPAFFPAAIVATPALLWFRHLAPRRRRAATLVSAAALCSATVWAALILVVAGERSASPWLLAAGAIAVPWPGHVLALVPGWARPVPIGGTLVHDAMARSVKRTFDVVVAALLGAPAAPILAIASILVRLTTPGPALYSQTRVTRGGRVFRIWKLRTMVHDAERGSAVWPEENDPRITRIGRVLRGIWLDEVPQLWNVLRGDMSLVGPRPERPEFVEAFAEDLPKYRERHAVTAGITGLAQVAGLIGNTSIRRRLALDLRYIRIWTPGLDVWILAKTAALALRRAFGLRPSGRAGAAPGGGGSTLGVRGGARHLPERDQ